MHIPVTLEGQVLDLYEKIAELERRNRNRKRSGVIKEIDLEKGRARVELSKQKGMPFLTDWLPWKEIAAGGIKTHIPPTVGEEVDVLSENGDLTDAIIDMSIPSTDNPRPHDGAEAVITKGDTRIEIADDAVTITTNVATVNADTINLGGEGGARVARVGDHVYVNEGSSTGLWPIVEGSSVVHAVD